MRTSRSGVTSRSTREADRVIRSVKVIQGAAKEARQIVVSRDQTPPTGNGESVPLWIRDGWSASEKELLDAARAAGTDSPTVFVFLPRQAADDLRKLIVDAEAAQQTIDAKGTPTTREGEEARHSMESRRNAAVRQRDELVKQIVANAKVYPGGRLRAAAGDARGACARGDERGTRAAVPPIQGGRLGGVGDGHQARKGRCRPTAAAGRPHWSHRGTHSLQGRDSRPSAPARSAARCARCCVRARTAGRRTPSMPR